MPSSWRRKVQVLLTVQILGTPVEALFILFALLGRCLVIRERRCEQARTRLDQKADHRQVVARRCRREKGYKLAWRGSIRSLTCTVKWRPAVWVLCIHVATKLHQKSVGKRFLSQNFKIILRLCDNSLDDLQMAGTDGVVEGGDALVVSGTRVGDLHGRLLHQLKFALEAGVEQQR